MPSPRSTEPSSFYLATTGCLHLALAGFFAWAFYVRYWRWRECIDEASSSCVTPDGDNLTAGGAFWLLPACIFLILSARNGYRWLKR